MHIQQQQFPIIISDSDSAVSICGFGSSNGRSRPAVQRESCYIYDISCIFDFREICIGYMKFTVMTAIRSLVLALR
jgi:hypothetical protein